VIAPDWYSDTSPLRTNRLLALALVLAAVGTAATLRWLIGMRVGGPFFLVFLPAALICAALSGLLYGVLATALGIAVTRYWWIAPFRSFDLGTPQAMTNMVGFTIVAAALCVAVARGVRAIARQAELADQNAALAIKSDSLATTNQALVHEMEHRLRNQLQFIATTLTLQRRNVNDAAAAAALDQASQRIQSIAAIHKRLFASAAGAIDFHAYLRDLCEDIVRNAGATNVSLHVSAPKANVPEHAVMPVSLIVSEVLNNAIKYGLSGKSDGAFEVSMTEAAPGRYEMAVGDNGHGLPPNFRFATQQGLGFRLILAFASQINGEFQIAPGPGARFRLTFPADLAA
jgi:two-component system, sensor histidine kinase PdtaS